MQPAEKLHLPRTMDVYEAVTSRRAVRGFTDRPVPREVLERVLSAAAWAPSGSNLQPWSRQGKPETLGVGAIP